MKTQNEREARRLIWTLKYGVSDDDLRRLAQILNYADAATLQKDIESAWSMIRADQGDSE